MYNDEVEHGVYGVPFFVNTQEAHKTGCTQKDIDVFYDLLVDNEENGLKRGPQIQN